MLAYFSWFLFWWKEINPKFLSCVKAFEFTLCESNSHVIKGHRCLFNREVAQVWVRPEDVTSYHAPDLPSALWYWADDNSPMCTSPERNNKLARLYFDNKSKKRFFARGKWDHDSTTGLVVNSCILETIMVNSGDASEGVLASFNCSSNHLHCSDPNTSPSNIRPKPKTLYEARIAAATIAESGKSTSPKERI